MDSVTLTGTTIRGSVRGRLVNCAVKSAPVGLRLPPGAYVLKIESNPIHGAVVSIEAAPGSPGAPSSIKFSNQGPAAAVATLVPPGAPAMDLWKTPAGAPATHHFKDSPASPRSVVIKEPPAKPLSPGAASAKFFETGPSGAAGARPSRVLITAQAIGENCLVATAGFADLLDAVRGAGTVALVVK